MNDSEVSPEKVYIFDTTLRDGEQVPGCKLDTEKKVFVAEALDNLGVDIIEAGFPRSSPGDFTSVREISKIVKNSVVCALSRAVKKDIDVAAEALSFAKHPRIHTGIGTSDMHIKYKFNSTRSEILDRATSMVKYAKGLCEDVEFYAEDAGRTDLEYLARVCESVIKAGATVLNVPDTTGSCLPEEYGDRIRYLKEYVSGIDNVIISCHCHNDFGLATANAISGVVHGARQIECTINGIGERAGNTALEEVVMLIHKKFSSRFMTSINSKELVPISRMVSDVMGTYVQSNKAVVGSNAFAHSSGIHQDGVIKHRENYEVIAPEEVGADGSLIILTARSGRSAVAYRARAFGCELTKLELDVLYEKFLELADKVKEVTDDDIKQLLSSYGHG